MQIKYKRIWIMAATIKRIRRRKKWWGKKKKNNNNDNDNNIKELISY